MSAEKPARVEGDPEGYEPVFDGESDGCDVCALQATELCVPGRPCLPWNRPERLGVHYVRAEKGRNAWDIGEELNSGAWYKGGYLWYRDWRDAGDISEVRINGKEYRP